MTTVTVTIKDTESGELQLEGVLDNPNAINEAPTPALVVASYLAANCDEICRQAIRWFASEVANHAEEAAEQ
jgi:hypothetical protein